LITSLAIPFWEAPGIYVTYLQGKTRFDLLNTYDVVSQFVTIGAVTATIFFTDNVLILLSVYLASWGIIRLVLFYLTVRQFPPNTLRDPTLISYGTHLTVMQAAAATAMIADKALLWHFLGPVAVAVYTFAQAIPLRAASVLKIVNRLAFPKMAAQEYGVLKQSLPRKIGILFIFGMICAFAYIALAPILFKIFFPQYMDAVFYTQIAAFLIPLQPFSLLSSALSAQAKKTSLYLFHFGNPVLRIAIFAISIPLWGLMGAVVALILAKIIENMLLAWLFYRS
jgi:O-antigen/teichoic acid export membrane protein